jgi:hypothetical protein
MTGCNCAIVGCNTSPTSNLSLFKIPCVGKADGNKTKSKKKTGCKE